MENRKRIDQRPCSGLGNGGIPRVISKLFFMRKLRFTFSFRRYCRADFVDTDRRLRTFTAARFVEAHRPCLMPERARAQRQNLTIRVIFTTLLNQLKHRLVGLHNGLTRFQIN